VRPHRVMAEAVREIGRVVRGATETHNRLRERIVALIGFTILVALVTAVIAWLLERHARGTEIHNFGDALFWTSTQLLTVSSSLKNPVTSGGKVLDVVMEIYAITVVSTLAGAFAAFLHSRGRERHAAAHPSA
jgi:ABC-type phosphate/phosphonate transport system permease subunit